VKGWIEAWNALFILGSVNSLFLGLILLGGGKPKTVRLATRFLSIILFSWSFGFFYTYIIETGSYRTYPHILLIGASFTFLTGPCLYFYTETLLGGWERIRARIGWNRGFLHFLPFLLNTLLLVPFFLKTGPEKIQYWESQRPTDSWFLLMQVFQLLHLGIYLALLFIRIYRHRAGLGEHYSTLEGLTLDWLRNIVLFGWIGLCVYIAALVLFRYWTGVTEYINRFTDLIVLGILHVLGYEALTQPEIFKKELSLDRPPLPSRQHAISGEGAVSAQNLLDEDPLTRLKREPAYERSPLTPAEVKDIAHRVRTHLQNTQAYLDETLSLRDLAVELSLSPHHLSQVINQELGMNFFELVNRERVRHAQQLILSSTSNLLDIALESGFRSKSTFNSLFKQYTGLTPSEYRKNLSSRRTLP